MKSLSMMAVLMSAAVALSGCAATKNLLSKRDNGSLDYRHSQKLALIQLPANQLAGEFVPLYPTPNVQSAGELTDFTNASGRQYELPKPPSVVR